MYNNNNPKSNTLRGCAMMLGMDVQVLANLLNFYESEKKRFESGQSSGLFSGLGEKGGQATIHHADPTGSGGHTGVPTQGNLRDARKRTGEGLGHVCD
jgi:hypothetical protein